MGEHPGQALDPLADDGVLAAQVRRGVGLRVVEDLGHLLEAERDLAVGE
ncbi:MAG: hypothetical protein H7233_10655 [Pseudorhodobacter sp.]|nr:hypothetical protein [Frankiaceae bacterium]